MQGTNSSHPEVVEVVTQSGSFASYAVARKAFPPGAVLAILKEPLLTRSKSAYSSVQVGVTENDHVELNCDFLYINHSCRPSLEFHVIGNFEDRSNPLTIEIRVAKRKNENGREIGLLAGEMLTFFYPSTEWNMTQPFDCSCGCPECLKNIQGAKDLPEDLVFSGRYFFNDYILELKRGQASLEKKD